MPKDKDFKRLVRDRMRETGERYAEARSELRREDRRIAPGEQLRGVLEFPEGIALGVLRLINIAARSKRRVPAAGRVEIADNEHVTLVLKKPVPLEAMPSREELEAAREPFDEWMQSFLARHAATPEPDLAPLDTIDQRLIDSLAFEVVGAPSDISRLPRFTTLKSLDLRHMEPFADVDFAPIRDMRQLERLVILNTGTTDDVLQHLPLGSLRHLELPRCGITDQGALEIARHSNLESINLAETNITDHGAQALLALPKLHQLQLAGTDITDTTLRAIAARTPPVPRVGVEDCQGITSTAIDDLKSANPDLDLLPPFTSRRITPRPGGSGQPTSSKRP